MKPNRQTAIGKPCVKHPELNGLRYVPNRLCVECAKTKRNEVYAARELTVSQEITVLRSEVTRLKAENAALSKERDKLAEEVRGLLEDFAGAL